MSPSPAFKICGLMRHVDAEVADRAGAAYGGVILAAGHRRSVDPATASRIFHGLRLRRVGVFVDPEVPDVLSAVRAAGLDVVQLHGDEPPDLAARLRNETRGTIWKAIRVRSVDDVAAAVARYTDAVDGLLLDGWSPAARGGAGASFRWEELAEHMPPIPSYLDLVVAGGLRPDNVARAARLLRPQILDVSSGVESQTGIKDHGLIRAFAAAIDHQNQSS